VLRRYCLAGELSPTRRQEAIIDLLHLPISSYPHDIFLDRIWALRNNMTAYDAVFVALAESLPARLLTCDVKLPAATGHDAEIILIPQFRIDTYKSAISF
jgi:predicted nucleic acid-binding protein